MYQRCLICLGPFQANDELHHVPHGKRLAYDPTRGRLWVVCGKCRRWSLAPLEERWEALEELEKVVQDRARLLSQTDNIALLRAGALEIVRVGRANRTEEAWWRYGNELRDRRVTARKLSLVGAAATGAVVVGGWFTGGMTFLGMWFLWNAPEGPARAARWLRFGSSAWTGRAECPTCGHVFRSLPYRERSQLHLLPDSTPGELTLSNPCPACGDFGDSGLVLRGAQAERTLRRLLAYQHFHGASERRVHAATRLIEEAGSARDLTRIVVKDGRRLGDVQRTGAIALEIATNETAEQRLLGLELAELESRWREEEELAAIVDDELTPLPALEALRRRVAGLM